MPLGGPDIRIRDVPHPQLICCYYRLEGEHHISEHIRRTSPETPGADCEHNHRGPDSEDEGVARQTV